MMVVDPYRFGGSGPATLTYQAAYVPTMVGLTGTQTGVAFGPVGGARAIIIAIHWYATVTTSVLSSATIGGIVVPTITTGTMIGPGTSAYIYTGFIAAFVPSGTSGTVVLNFSGGGGTVDARIFVYQALNIVSLTPHATGQNASTISPVSTTCDLEANGIVLAAGSDFQAAPATWTGITESYDTSPGLGELSGGGALTPSTVTGAAFQFADAGGVTGIPTRSIFVASFR